MTTFCNNAQTQVQKPAALTITQIEKLLGEHYPVYGGTNKCRCGATLHGGSKPFHRHLAEQIVKAQEEQAA